MGGPWKQNWLSNQAPPGEILGKSVLAKSSSVTNHNTVKQ